VGIESLTSPSEPILINLINSRSENKQGRFGLMIVLSSADDRIGRLSDQFYMDHATNIDTRTATLDRRRIVRY
jgi:hypothetical protein